MTFLAAVAISIAIGYTIRAATESSNKWKLRFMTMTVISTELIAAIVKQPSMTDEQKNYGQSNSSDTIKLVRDCMEEVTKM